MLALVYYNSPLLTIRLEFGTVPDNRPSSGERAKTPSQVQHSNDIIGMMSPDGEKVALGKGLKARSVHDIIP